MAVLAAGEMLSCAVKGVKIEVNPVLVALENVPVILSGRILNDGVLVLGISVLVNLIERDGPLGGWFLRRLFRAAS